VQLSREPTALDFLEAGIPACVSRVIPVIELHHHVMRGERPSAFELIAHNALHAGYVAGGGVNPDEVPHEPSLAIFADDRLLDACEGPSLIQTIRSSLKWLMDELRARGDRLAAGQIILTGSIPSLIPIGEDCRIRVEAGSLGRVEVTFRT
jgi:2-keto-4-pentenoate hydratase